MNPYKVKPCQGTLDMLSEALEESRSLPQEGRRLQEKLECVVRTYSSWLDASADLSAADAVRFFGETFKDAIAEAEEWGYDDISILLGCVYGDVELQKLIDEDEAH